MGYDIGYYVSKVGLTPAIEQGSTFLLPFTVTLDATTMAYFTKTGALDANIRATYHPSGSNTGVSFDILSIVRTSDTLLTCKVGMSSTVTAGLTPGTGHWDCEIFGKTVPSGMAAVYVMKPLGSWNKAKVVGESTHA